MPQGTSENRFSVVLERGPQRAHKLRYVRRPGRGAEEREVRSLQRRHDAMVREPRAVGPIDVAGRPVTAVERHRGTSDGREPLGEVGVEGGLGHRDEAPTGTDGVVEAGAASVVLELGLDEELAGAG